MQTFLPYESFRESAKVLDWRRLGKQRVECMQIINAIENPNAKGWVNHPITKMWENYVEVLKSYSNIIIQEWIDRGYNNNMEFYPEPPVTYHMPTWLGKEEFHSSHRANLLRKDPEWYGQFNWTEDPSSPYVWLDDKHLWYEQQVGTGIRVYI